MADPASPRSMIVTPAAVCSVHNLRGPPRPRAATHVPDPTALCTSSAWPFRRHYGPYRAIPVSLTTVSSKIPVTATTVLLGVGVPSVASSRQRLVRRCSNGSGDLSSRDSEHVDPV
jgi:hypothetical protein